jgi:hypothetical protein
MAFCIVGLGLWVGATVAVAVVNDDPSNGRPVVLTFGGGAAAFFGAMFGAAWWQTRARSTPELDALLSELSLEPQMAPRSARAIGGMRRTARAYIALGALVTALGLAAIVQEGLELGDPRTTLLAMVAIVVAWAAAVPFVIRRAQAASRAVLTPLGLSQNGAELTGERHGRRVSVSIGPRGSVTRIEAGPEPPRLQSDEILAYAGRGAEAVWEGVSVGYERAAITVRREGHRQAAWLWDLWLAERLASEDPAARPTGA